MWIAARSSAAASSSGASSFVKRPWPSSHTLPGPLIMISLTSGSASAASNPGKKGFNRSSASCWLIAVLSVWRSSTGGRRGGSRGFK